MKSPADKLNDKRQRKDKQLRFTVTFFGALVLFTLILLVTHLVSQALPLAMRPSMSETASISIQGLPGLSQSQILTSGDLLENQPLIVQEGDCRISMFVLTEQLTLQPFHDYIRPCEHSTQVITEQEQQYVVDVSAAGQLRILEVQAISLPAQNPAGSEHTQPAHTPTVSFALPMSTWQSRMEWEVGLSDTWAVATVKTPDTIFVRWVNRANPTLVYDHTFASAHRVLALPGSGVMLVNNKTLLEQYTVGGTHTDQLIREPVINWFRVAKDRSVIIETADHVFTRWVLHNQNGSMKYRPSWSIVAPDNTSATSVSVHATTNALMLLTNNKQVLLINRVTGEIVNTQSVEQQYEQAFWFGRNLYFSSETDVSIYQVHWLSGITTWSSLFSPHLYEGYEEAATVWQSSSGSDFQETKYSLVPLLMGSLKASLLALIIAIPLSIGAAIYTAYFCQTRIRYWLKPAIELLEAIPSVLIGFVAAIWLAPMAERVLFAFAFFLFVIPVLLLAVAYFQHRVSRWLPLKLRRGTELIILPISALLLGYFSMHWMPDWLFAVLEINGFDVLSGHSQSPIGKTTIVVALALGVAIAPTIYSLAEDAINGVPQHLKHASFALGATRLQTLHHIVFQIAMPGILAAIMMGFGRAFGETMIVLMVTGNTPVADWSLLEGLRALTANLAIELPEADVNSVHFQVLFFTACILFGFTFVVNTFAELLRQRLRRGSRYD